MSDPAFPTDSCSPEASSDRVELWHAPVSSDHPGPIETCCLRWLDAGERARAERFRQPRSRHQHIVGRGMARRLLAGSRGAPASIRFEHTPLGKPYVAAPPAADRLFNIAHTDRLGVCAVAPAPAAAAAAIERLGVDVERCGRRTSPELAQRYFSRPEYEFLASHEDPEVRRELFLRIWTLKESFIKAIGTGLQTPLADFAFADIESPSPQVRMLNRKLESDLVWSFSVLHPRPGFVSAVAVATKRDPAPFRLHVGRFEALIDGELRGG